jgi:uncharacterized protein YegL
MVRIAAFIFLLSAIMLRGQTLSLFNIDTTGYPRVSGKIYAFDSEGSQLVDIISSGIKLTENDIERQVLDINCPQEIKPVPISGLLVVDMSGSMKGENLKIAKAAARGWVNAMPESEWECAITGFNSENYIIQDFTGNREQLLRKVNTLYANGGTDYNSAFLEPKAGAFEVIERAKYKKIIVFLTDGFSNEKPRKKEMIEKAIQSGVSVYCVMIGGFAPDILKDLSDTTGSIWFQNIRTEEEAKKAYFTFLKDGQEIEPCEIEWMSDYYCEGVFDINVNVSLDEYGISDEESYKVKENATAYLEMTPNTVKFKNPPIGVKQDTTVVLKAVNADFEVTSLILSNPNFEISPSQFNLSEGGKIELTLSYTASDSNYAVCKIDLINGVCPKSVYVMGGWKGKKIKVPTLEITHPDGGEKFLQGSDTLITWTGIPKTDTVSIEYSSDNGRTWNLIAEKATGNEYIWKGIPGPESDNCLIRVIHGSQEDIHEPGIEWEGLYGGSNKDNLKSVKESPYGGYIAAGWSWSPVSGDKTEQFSRKDGWVIKVLEGGQLEWEKTFGDRYDDEFNSLYPTIEGNYILGGFRGTDVSWGTGSYDYWICEIDLNGNKIREKALGGTSLDQAFSVIQSSDGGYLLSGITKSNDGDLSPGNYKGKQDMWLVKLNNNFDIEWEKCFGGSDIDFGETVIETSDGCFVVCGATQSKDGDVDGKFVGYVDGWIVRVDRNGKTLWKKTFGGYDYDYIYGLAQRPDGGFVICGFTHSHLGDKYQNSGVSDLWVARVDKNGDVIWQNCYGDAHKDYSYSIISSADGGIVVAGTISTQEKGFGTKEKYDGWVIKLNADGDLLWQKRMGMETDDKFFSVSECSDYGFILGGYSNSGRWANEETGRGVEDYWLVKLEPDGSVLQTDVSDNVFSVVKPKATSDYIDMQDEVIGKTKDSVIHDFIVNSGQWPVRIDSIYFTGEDSNAFKLIGNAPKYFIQPGMAEFGEFSFTPTKAGWHKAVVNIVTQSEIIETEIIGNGIEPKLAVVSNIIDFEQIEVGNFVELENIVTIKNISPENIEIIKTVHYFPNDEDFSTIDGGGNFILEPGESRQMHLRFEPTYIGHTSGNLEFHYEGTGSPANVQLYGEGIEGERIIEVQTELFQPLVCDSVSIGLLKIRNIGSGDLILSEVYLAGDNSDDFNILTSLPIVLPGDSIVNIEIIFEPQTPGAKFAEIIIKSNAKNNDELSIDVSGIKEKPEIVFVEKEINLGKIFINEPIDFALTIMNTGTIDNTALIGQTGDFVFSENSIYLGKSEQGNIKIHFPGSSSPEIIDENLIITDSICGKESKIRVILEVINHVNSELNVPDTEAYPGQNFRVPVIINNREEMQKLVKGTIDFELEFNSTLLWPFDYQPVIVNNLASKIEITDLSLESLENDTLVQIWFKAALGNATETGLILSNVESSSGRAEISVSNGSFTLLGICEEGGTRLINPNSRAGILSIAPNPASNKITFHVSITEKGLTELAIYDIMGEKVKTVYEGFNSTDDLESFDEYINLSADISDISSGQYIVVFKTPTYIESRQISIIK